MSIHSEENIRLKRTLYGVTTVVILLIPVFGALTLAGVIDFKEIVFFSALALGIFGLFENAEIASILLCFSLFFLFVVLLFVSFNLAYFRNRRYAWVANILLLIDLLLQLIQASFIGAGWCFGLFLLINGLKKPARLAE